MRLALGLLLAHGVLLTPALSAEGEGGAVVDGHGDGLAILAGKALCVPLEGPQVINDAVVLIRGKKIEAVGRQGELQVPDGYSVLDVGDRWISPGMVDLHCHVAGANFFVNDLNDTVYLTNSGLRAYTGVVPEATGLLRGAAAGVTSVLYIPGSGSNMGGSGVLLKTAAPTYEEMEIRNPGSLKLAQAGNPEGWAVGVGRAFMNWNTRNTFRRGLAYAARMRDAANGEGDEPERDIQFDVFRDLLAKRTQVSTHTQIYQVVLMTITMVRKELGLDVYIDHGSFDGWRTAPLAAKEGVQAILGPRAIAVHLDIEYRPNMYIRNDTDGAIFGMAAKYQEGGVKQVGFNTDSPVIPQEELPLQSAMAVRYGFDTQRAEHVRGLTIVPATTAGIGHRVGSLEPGKDADIVITDGDPADPRTHVLATYIEGRKVYSGEERGRTW